MGPGLFGVARTGRTGAAAWPWRIPHTNKAPIEILMPHQHPHARHRKAQEVWRHVGHYLGAALLIVLVAWSTAPSRAAISLMVF